ncbi:DnaJ domain-containing protein [Labrys miyagiensis]|uniref:DnaJ domain-containing protein n=1 Tax=Labrys miyagiensis TaxID=346912 RepID=UPI0024E07582|nr:DnaJ domain-containing protein [Labrys miyagiensis]
MGQFIFGCVILICLWPFLKPGALSKTPFLDRLMRNGGSFLAFSLGLFLLTRGEWGVGIPFLILATGMRGWLPKLPEGVVPGTRARTAYVRTIDLVIMLDAARQPVDGQVLRGIFLGRRLSSLQAAELLALRRQIAADFVGRSILEAYLDRRLAGWREHFKDDANAGYRGGAASDAMSKQEAYQILGVQPGASAEEIRRAHRTLMKKIHPDKGGTTQMAARVNRARDILLEGH